MGPRVYYGHRGPATPAMRAGSCVKISAIREKGAEHAVRERKETPDADVDVAALMERVRERIGPPSAAERDLAVPASLADPRGDLATLHETSDVRRPTLGSHRKIFGPAVLVVKRLLLRFLAPSLDLQARHNTATTRLLTHVAARLESLERRVEDLSSRLAGPDDGGPP